MLALQLILILGGAQYKICKNKRKVGHESWAGGAMSGNKFQNLNHHTKIKTNLWNIGKIWKCTFDFWWNFAILTILRFQWSLLIIYEILSYDDLIISYNNNLRDRLVVYGHQIHNSAQLRDLGCDFDFMRKKPWAKC